MYGKLINVCDSGTMPVANVIFAALSLVVLWTADAAAVDFSFDGYVDARLVIPPNEKAWLDGGLGKARYGSAQPDPNFRFAEAVGQGVLSLAGMSALGQKRTFALGQPNVRFAPKAVIPLRGARAQCTRAAPVPGPVSSQMTR